MTLLSIDRRLMFEHLHLGKHIARTVLAQCSEERRDDINSNEREIPALPHWALVASPDSILLVDVWIQEEKPASTNESAKYRRMTKQSLGVLQTHFHGAGCKRTP
jgi:hypothetical protein